ncbi:MAG: putative porin [Deltaproteobacteria bacterium]|nr:putative porin [Deltaproteobacteria bacterium]
MMRRIAVILVLAAGVCLFFVAAAGPVQAGEMDILVNKLVEKGILTRAEAEALITEMRAEAERTKSTEPEPAPQPGQETSPGAAPQTAKAAAVEEAKNANADLPAWVRKMTVKGDVRLRYQNDDTQGDFQSPRGRERARFRIGADVEVAEHWKVGFGLTTGSADPRSANQTFQQTFETPDIRLDYAYAQYQPWQFLKFIGGKQKNQLWRPKDMMWDTDIRPEGITAPFNTKLDGVELFGLPAFYRLAEFKSNNDDSYMWLVNAGADFKFSKNMNLKVAATYFDFANMKGNSFKWSSGTNSTDAAGNLIYDYDSFTADGEFSIRFPGPVPYAAAFGQYVYAIEPEHDNQGWLAGIKFGHRRLNKFAQWQVKYNYRRFERDAWPDFFPDKDFAGGGTNAKGHEVEAYFGLSKNISLKFDYYFEVKPIKEEEFGKQKLIQVDLLLKF